MAAQHCIFCFGIPFFTCRFLSFQSIRSLNWSSHNTMRFLLYFPHFSNVQETFGTFLREVEQGGKSPFSLLSEPISPPSLLFEQISPSSLNVSFSFSPSSLLFPPISPSSQLYLGHFSLLPILFLPPHFSECEFVRLNPRFESFSHAFVMIKYTFKRIQKR